MKVLIIEDEFDKREKIRSHLISLLKDKVEIIECESLRSGLKKIIMDSDFDLILLDMSMPNFDTTEAESGEAQPESFAGREIMAQMQLRGIFIPVLVITQYRSFEKGTVSFDDLLNQFKDKYFDFFLGAIYYNSATEGWKKDLSDYIAKLS